MQYRGAVGALGFLKCMSSKAAKLAAPLEIKPVHFPRPLAVADASLVMSAWFSRETVNSAALL